MIQNPYQPTTLSSKSPSRSISALWFVVGVICGLNLYFAVERGFRSMISEMVSNPIGWIGPTAVFAVASVPFALLSAFAMRRILSTGDADAFTIVGGLIFGVAALPIDRWFDFRLSLLGKNGDAKS